MSQKSLEYEMDDLMVRTSDNKLVFTILSILFQEFR